MVIILVWIIFGLIMYGGMKILEQRNQTKELKKRIKNMGGKI